MPAIKSPGKMLQLWNRAKADYLRLNDATELEPPEDVQFKKTIKGLTRLRNLARNAEPDEGDAQFTGARDTLLQAMEKFRKLFKPKKAHATVKKYYQTVCRLILCVEGLGGAAELDASEEEAAANALDDLNAEELDQREEQPELVAAAATTADAVPEAPPLPGGAPARPAAPPADGAEAWRKEAKAVEPLLLSALRENRGDTSRMRAVFAYAQEKAGQHDYVNALKGLRSLRVLLNSGPPANGSADGEAVVNPADAEAGRFNARLQALIPRVLQARTTSPEAHQELKLRISEAGVFQRKREYARANALLDQVEALLRTAHPEAAVPEAPPLPEAGHGAPAAGPANAARSPADPEAARFTERLKALLPKVLEAQRTSPESLQELKLRVSEAQVFFRKHEFPQAHALLDQVEALVRRAHGDAAPAADATATATSQAPPAAERPADEARPTSALPLWREAKELVNRQIGQLQGYLRQSNDADLMLIADRGLNGITGRLQVGLQAALMDLDRAAGEVRTRALAKTQTLLTGWRQFLQGDALVRLLDTNPFGVAVSIRQTLGEALDNISRALSV